MVGLDVEFDAGPVALDEILGDLAGFVDVRRTGIQADGAEA